MSPPNFGAFGAVEFSVPSELPNDAESQAAPTPETVFLGQGTAARRVQKAGSSRCRNQGPGLTKVSNGLSNSVPSKTGGKTGGHDRVRQG